MTAATTAKTLLATVVATLLTSCAGVNFYSDSRLTAKTGIPIYAPKPYVLVARTGAKDKPVEVSIVYLNDPQRVIYADPRSGFGSSKLTLALANGQLTAFGQETDPKIAELIASIGGLITARAGAAKTEAEAADIRSKTGTTLQAAVSAIETGKNVKAIADDMKAKINDGSLKGLTEQELKTVQSAAQALSAAGLMLSDPANIAAAPQQLEIVKAQTDALGKLPDASGTSNQRDAALQLVRTWATQLAKHYVAAQPEKADLPVFELYEIVQGVGAVTLKRVSP